MTLLPFVRLGSNMEFISNLPISVSQTRLKRRKRKHARILWTGSSHSSFLYILHPSSRSFFPFLKCSSAVLLKFFPTQLADTVWLNQWQLQAYLGESKVIQMHKEIAWVYGQWGKPPPGSRNQVFFFIGMVKSILFHSLKWMMTLLIVLMVKVFWVQWLWVQCRQVKAVH